MNVQNVIVGAGLSGIVIAQRLAKKGEKVFIIEKRNHIGGNCYDYFDKNGILIHKYGPHIFHTNMEDVWEYLNTFTKFTNFQHKVLAWVDSNLIPVPFNFNSIETSFAKELAKKIENSLLEYYEYGSKVSISELRRKAQETKDTNLRFVADYIFEKVFKNYTVKQWGINAEDINPSVLKRVPVVMSRDNRYFPHHKYQGMPEDGYTKMFEKMLSGKNIHVVLNTDYEDVIHDINYKSLYFTGPIDRFFNYKYGKLDYKKTLYQLEEHEKQSYQENIVINYPNDYEYTRITEFKKFYPNSPTFGIDKTVICKEIPGIGNIDAYPVETDINLEILEKYKDEAQKIKNVHFLGRLANYKYMDMDQTIKNALDFKI
ncbi:UDP-galactopyranose mutase [Candidatus Gracilibacteria bacterium]|nr:MAG: UDP-galactopyranose mutase [Candidatus Gracilibacteria bacterium]